MEPVIGPRRREVLDLWRQGLTVRLIALQLGVATQTIYGHIDALRSAGLIPEKEAS